MYKVCKNCGSGFLFPATFGLFFPARSGYLRPARTRLLGIVNTGFGCWCYFSAIGALSVQTVAVCGYLEPLSAVIFSALLLHERLTTAQMIGAVLILGGALFAECVHSKQTVNKKRTA